MDSFKRLSGFGNAEEAQERGIIRLQFIVGVCLTVVLLSALMLIGWSVGTPLFTVLYPGYESVKPNTAAAFILAASSLWLLASLHNTVPRRLLGISFGWAVSAIGMFTLFEYVSGMN